MSTLASTPDCVVADDVCALPLARRMAAMLDRDPSALRTGDPLPRGWHPLLFNAPTRQSELRHDGAAALGVTLPDLGLPRLMLGGRRIRFDGDIPIGAAVRRESRQGGVTEKTGRSGRFAIVNVEHRIFPAGGCSGSAVVIESQDYIMREAGGADANGAAANRDAMTTAARPSPPPNVEPADAERLLVPDAMLLFRYSAITDNPHRIHYDLPYATEREGYPALVVNGSIPAMFLLELFRAHVGREPVTLTTRNVAPMFAGHPLRLALRANDDGRTWRLWAADADGPTTFDATVE